MSTKRKATQNAESKGPHHEVNQDTDNKVASERLYALLRAPNTDENSTRAYSMLDNKTPSSTMSRTAAVAATAYQGPNKLSAAAPDIYRKISLLLNATNQAKLTAASKRIHTALDTEDMYRLYYKNQVDSSKYPKDDGTTWKDTYLGAMRQEAIIRHAEELSETWRHIEREFYRAPFKSHDVRKTYVQAYQRTLPQLHRVLQEGGAQYLKIHRSAIFMPGLNGLFESVGASANYKVPIFELSVPAQHKMILIAAFVRGAIKAYVHHVIQDRKTQAFEQVKLQQIENRFRHTSRQPIQWWHAFPPDGFDPYHGPPLSAIELEEYYRYLKNTGQSQLADQLYTSIQQMGSTYKYWRPADHPFLTPLRDLIAKLAREQPS